MNDVEDLNTDNINELGRRYREKTLADVDRVATAMRSDPRPRVRANAVTALMELLYFRGKKDQARAYLLEALSDSSPDVEARAANSLADWFLEEPDVRKALAAHTDQLRAAAASTDPIIQAHAVSALQTMGERPPAEGTLHASSSAIRRRAIEQARDAHDVKAAPALAELARSDPETVVRVEAIPVAAELSSPEVRDALLDQLIADPTVSVASAAVLAAGTSGAKSLIPKLRQILSAPAEGRTHAAVVALAKLGDRDAAPLIAAHLGDRSDDTKWDAKLALDALVGPARDLKAWQSWAREHGYLH